MNQPCPNCGNRQHSPDATICRVCGQPLNSALGNLHTESLPGNNPPKQIGSGQSLPVQFNPCLMDEQGRQYAIVREGETLVGSYSSADIYIKGPNVQPRHARIYLSGGQIFLEAMIGCLVLVNGRATGRQAYRLRDQDIITFGSRLMMQYQVNGVAQQPRGNDATGMDDNDIIVSPTTRPQVRRLPSPSQNCDLYGRVRHVDGPHLEDPDPSLGRALAKVTGFALALWKPAFLLFQKPNQQIPVRFLRIETTVGDIRMVKMKGNLVTGTLHTGDFVLFWGEWQNGTLLMHRGYNETAQANILLRQ